MSAPIFEFWKQQESSIWTRPAASLFSLGANPKSIYNLQRVLTHISFIEFHKSTLYFCVWVFLATRPLSKSWLYKMTIKDSWSVGVLQPNEFSGTAPISKLWRLPVTFFSALHCTAASSYHHWSKSFLLCNTYVMEDFRKAKKYPVFTRTVLLPLWYARPLQPSESDYRHKSIQWFVRLHFCVCHVPCVDPFCSYL